MAADQTEITSVRIFTGLYNTLDGIFLGIDGEAYPRVQITPQGLIKTGDGLSPPVTFTGGGGGGLTQEDVRDTIASALTAGNNIDITPNDGADIITIDVEGLTSVDISDLVESIQDVMAGVGIGAGGGLVAGSTITLSYNDTNGQLTINTTGLQPLDSDLTAIAALSTTSFGRAFLTLTDAAASRTYINAEVAGAAAAAQAASQPLDADLTAIAALSTTAFGRSLLASADAAALRALAALGTAAVVNTGTGASDVPTITQADARYQPLDSDLTAIAALSTTSFGRSLLAAADAAALRTLAALGSLATVTPTGTPDGTKFLRDDNSWAAPPGGGGSVATDTIWDNADDLAVGTGSNTAAKLAVPASRIIAKLATGSLKAATPAEVKTLLAIDTTDISNTINTQTGSYTLVLTDAGKIVSMNVATANNLTVPPNSSVAFPVGTRIPVFQLGAGLTTIIAGAGVTLDALLGTLVLPRQFGRAELIKIGTDEWIVSIPYQPGTEIGYAEITANPTALTTSAADVTGLSVSVEVGGRPVMGHIFIPTTQATAGSGRIFVTFNEGATVLSRGESAYTATQVGGHVDVWARLGGARQPSQGSHTYKTQAAVIGGATAGLLICSTTYPAFIELFEI